MKTLTRFLSQSEPKNYFITKQSPKVVSTILLISLTRMLLDDHLIRDRHLFLADLTRQIGGFGDASEIHCNLAFRLELCKIKSVKSDQNI